MRKIGKTLILIALFVLPFTSGAYAAQSTQLNHS